MVNKVWTKGHRNLVEQVVVLHPRVTVVVGPNNQGKTNFLEAIYFLMTGKSPFRVPLDMMIGMSLPNSQLGLSAVGLEGDRKLYIDLLRDGAKRIQWSGELVKSHRSVVASMAVQYWSADVLWLFQESPSFRRDFLDLFCEHYFADFSGIDRRYQAVLKQKNALLTLFPVDMVMLDLLNRQLAENGAEIVKYRMRAISLMMEIVLGYLPSYFPDQGQMITIVYSLCGIGDGVGVDAYSAELLSVLTANRDREVRVKQALYGPHRDDFVVKVGDMPMVGYYSRGMTRLFALLLSFSQLLLLKTQHQRTSVLLLDDAFSELDLSKKKSLMMDFSTHVQVVYTTVLDEDRTLIDDLLVYRMELGRMAING